MNKVNQSHKENNQNINMDCYLRNQIDQGDQNNKKFQSDLM